MLCGKKSVMNASSRIVTSFCFIVIIHLTIVHFTLHKVNREQKVSEREVKEKVSEREVKEKN